MRVRWLSGAALVALCSLAMAQDFPAKPIRFVLGFAPGGFGDITVRMLGQKITQITGQQVIIDNRPSAGSVISASMVARSEPDGYTLALAGSGTAASASLFKSLPYNILNDFVLVTSLGVAEVVLITGPDSQLATVQQIVAFARENPGKLNIASGNIGSTQYLAAELFKSMAAIDAQVVPFKSMSALVPAVRSGEVHVAVEMLGPMMAQIRSRQLKAVAIGGERRFSMLPDVPTVAEAGVPGYQASSWNGVSVPRGTPRQIVDRLHQLFAAALDAPDVRQKLMEIGITPRSLTPEQTRQLMISDIAKWKAVIERANIPRQ